jgi:DNA repair protein RecO (recombination protein O)
LAREDAYESLYDQYANTVYALSQIDQSGATIEQTLRPFELGLLRETGYAAALDHCVETKSQPVSSERYVYQPEKGIRPWQPDDPSHWPVMDGSALNAMAQGDFTSSETLSQSKQLMRFLLSIHLQDQSLTTRQILIDLKKI